MSDSRYTTYKCEAGVISTLKKQTGQNIEKKRTFHLCKQPPIDIEKTHHLCNDGFYRVLATTGIPCPDCGWYFRG